jgi:alkanesulfonate monooxygenase SsuD/methylene tetrahydromethanopterin reductase-like flavin-dependent oxidoreductase (luciferase family)
MYRPWLEEGFARPGARHSAPWDGASDFEIAATCHLQITSSAEETKAVVDFLKPVVALYMGGMGAKEQNFHKNVFDRMGYAEVTDEVQRLFLSGQKDEATALIPDELVEDMHIIGSEAEVREKVAAWEATGVTTMLLSLQSAADVRRVAEVLG